MTAVSQFEKKNSPEKVVKHLQGFKLMLKHERENDAISAESYQHLYDSADYLMQKWQES
ncbi:hypothetical protein RWE15_17645 [Virgibacillus halophilus]|uniref:FIMAH domain-containing protein n=1 Tax=Tigheibacillus halophilus TaxID=361280 RepID=A0ABU5C953_9BACI|nr:hypothetical protein [Virgibacillus halophilus]